MPKKGYKQSDEHREKGAKSRIGRILSEETKRKISEGEKGKIVLIETREKISKFMTRSGYNIVHPVYSWSKYPKLRYELKNGITLCQAHHPKTRAKEELFRKKFSYLVNQK